MTPPPPPPAATSSGAAQYAAQFLSTALSQRGPNSLPYSEDSKWLIRQHLLALISAFPSLHPSTALYTHNDGRSLLLLNASGTLPVLHRGSLYNFPAVLWLLESYPRRPPAIFLCPTKDMLVKPHHPFVDPDGRLHDVPYLLNWVYPSSNLVDLLRSVAHLFGLDPPLYSRSPRPPPSAASTEFNYSNLIEHENSNSNSNNVSSQFNSFGGRIGPGPPSGRVMEDPAEVYRRNAVGKILEAVHADMAAVRREREGEMEGLFATQAELRRRGEEVGRGVGGMVEEKEGLEQQLQLVLMNSDVLEGWVRENEGKGRRGGEEVDVDGVFEPADGLSRQMLECTAVDMAIEDVVYSLDKAVQEGSVPFDSYLRSVRALAREQFFQRATLAKVRAAQVHAQVTSMAARAPQYAA